MIMEARKKQGERVRDNIVFGDLDIDDVNEEDDVIDYQLPPCIHGSIPRHCMPYAVVGNDDDNDDAKKVNENQDVENNQKTKNRNLNDNGITGPAENAYLKICHHIYEANSMRSCFHDLDKQAKKNSPDKVPVRSVCVTIIIDYAQNLELPSMNANQPGETIYFSPITVPAFGIVDCNSDDDQLYAYIYQESEGQKGGNNVALLIMKFLKDKGYLDGEKRLKLSIVCDNCTGQNKVFSNERTYTLYGDE